MTGVEQAAWLQAAAAIMTFGAATWAVIATYNGPRRAAEFAESMRRDTEASARVQAAKVQILTTLLKHRARMIHAEVAEAFNLIDLIFLDSKSVRDSYQEFWNSIAVDNPIELRRERYNSVIISILRDLKMDNDIKSADIQRAYIPDYLGKALDLQVHEIKTKWDDAFGSNKA